MINRRLGKYNQKLIQSDNFLSNQNYVSSNKLKGEVFKLHIFKMNKLYSGYLLMLMTVFFPILAYNLNLSDFYYFFAFFVFLIGFYSIKQNIGWFMSGKIEEITTKSQKNNDINNWYILRKKPNGISYKNNNRIYIRKKDFIIFKK